MTDEEQEDDQPRILSTLTRFAQLGPEVPLTIFTSGGHALTGLVHVENENLYIIFSAELDRDHRVVPRVLYLDPAFIIAFCTTRYAPHADVEEMRRTRVDYLQTIESVKAEAPTPPGALTEEDLKALGIT